MKIIENSKVKEQLYIEKLENGMIVMIVPKKNSKKKYVIWGTHYGSNDSKFIIPGENEPTEVPKGVAHFLEHKMFEQENGKNSLDVLTALGVEANAYTTNNHTAYLFECTNNFYEALDELMNYVQHPYFTDENVEKEKGIIGQEIMMYDDYPEWKVYLNALECMYHKHPVKLDITGTQETISHIDKNILYKCYNTFYNPSNMVMCVVGDFEPNSILKEIKKRLINKKPIGKITRIFEDEPETIAKKRANQKMQVSNPLFVLGIKDVPPKEDIVKKHLAIQVLVNLLIGSSSNLYKRLYESGNMFYVPGFEYEFEKQYAHILITGQSNDAEEVYKLFNEQINNFKKNGINEEDFTRIKKMIYGEYVREFNDVSDIARMFLSDYFVEINSFDYIDSISSLNIEYVNQILVDVFKEDKMVLSVVKN